MPRPPTPQLKRKPPLTAPPLSPPPPRKRPRLHPTPPPPPPSSAPPQPPRRPYTIPSPAPHHIRIYAWNVNGIAALLPPHPNRSTRQQPITTFLNRRPASSPHHGSSDQKPDDSAPEPLTGNGRGRGRGSGKGKGNANSLRARLRRWKYPEMVCLQEVQIARSDTATQRAVQVAVNPPRRRQASAARGRDAGATSSESSDDDDDDDAESPGPTYTAHFSLPRSAYNARGRRGDGKIYGVATIIRDDFARRELAVAGRSVEWDREGRVLVTELACGVLVMNVYAVNGTERVWRDEGDGRVVGTRHEMKRWFHGGLVGEWEGWVGGLHERNEDATEAGRHRGKGGRREVLMIGDMNVARDERDGWPGIRLGEQHVRNRADFERTFFAGMSEGGLGAVDTFREVHGGERRYSYFPPGRVWGRSCDRVDLGMVSRGLVEGGCLVGADILDDEMERGSSDHVPLYVVLKVGQGTNEKDTAV